MNLGFLETTGLAPLPAFLTSLALGLLSAQRPRPSPTEWALALAGLALVVAWRP